MSSSLYWSTDPKKERLSSDLKFTLRRLYGEPVTARLGISDIPTLRAFKAADPSLGKEVDLLIKMIEAHTFINLGEQN